MFQTVLPRDKIKKYTNIVKINKTLLKVNITLLHLTKEIMQPVGCCQHVIIKTQKKKVLSPQVYYSHHPITWPLLKLYMYEVAFTGVAFYLMFIFKECLRRFLF